MHTISILLLLIISLHGVLGAFSRSFIFHHSKYDFIVMDAVKSDLVVNLSSMLGCEPDVAQYFLEVSGWNGDVATNAFFEK